MWNVIFFLIAEPGAVDIVEDLTEPRGIIFNLEYIIIWIVIKLVRIKLYVIEKGGT